MYSKIIYSTYVKCSKRFFQYIAVHNFYIRVTEALVSILNELYRTVHNGAGTKEAVGCTANISFPELENSDRWSSA